MQVEIGHRAGIDAEDTPEHGVLYTPVEGERTTTFTIPDGTSLSEAMQSIKDALGYHVQVGGEVVWVRSDNKDLERWAMDQLGIDRRRNRAPANWGRPEGEPA